MTTHAATGAFIDPKFSQLHQRLSSLPKKKLTFEELTAEAAKLNVTRPELDGYLDHMHKEGKVFHFRQGGVDFVFLDTRVITNTLSDLLDPTGGTVKQMVAKKNEQLQVRIWSCCLFAFFPFADSEFRDGAAGDNEAAD